MESRHDDANNVNATQKHSGGGHFRTDSTQSKRLKGSKKYRKGGVSWITGPYSRFGLAIALFSIALQLCVVNVSVLREVLARLLFGESALQLMLGIFIRKYTLSSPFHFVLSLVSITVFFWRFPVDAVDEDIFVALFSILGICCGSCLLVYGIMFSQLEYYSSAQYWELENDYRCSRNQPHLVGSNMGIEDIGLDLPHRGPLALVFVLRLARLLVQILRMPGTSHSDTAQLRRHRDNFLYHVGNTSSYCPKALAIEQYFREILNLIIQRALRSVLNTESNTFSFFEQRFANRIIRHCEQYFRPLPWPLEPDSVFKCTLNIALAFLIHKRIFEALKSSKAGSLDLSIRVIKSTTRLYLLVYLVVRHIVTQYRR